MSVRSLVHLFEPRSVAVIGASNRPRHVGNVLMRNLLEGGIDAPVMPVNPKYRSVAGVLTYPDVESLPQVPELALICSPAPTIAASIDALGRRGTRVAIVVHDDLLGRRDPGGAWVRDAMLAAARRHSMRVL
ncbi:MAG TPA: CoA-binding protein, partial [Zeimonas sp.]|nr:CoA-binding protein [Zeimonas sp.]